MLLIVSFSFKVLCKRDAAQEAEIQRWIEAVLGENFPPGKPFEDCLKDGIMLCRLMNKLEPGIVPKINESGPSFKMMENVNRYAWDSQSSSIFSHLCPSSGSIRP